MNRQVRERGSERRLMERTRKLIPRERVRHTERSDQLYVMRMMLVVERGFIQSTSETHLCILCFL